MKVTIILTENDEEISHHTDTLPSIHLKELELIAEIGRRESDTLGDYYLVRTLLVLSGIGLDVFMKEYGAHRLREQVKSMKKWLPR